MKLLRSEDRGAGDRALSRHGLDFHGLPINHRLRSLEPHRWGAQRQTRRQTRRARKDGVWVRPGSGSDTVFATSHW